MIWQLWHRNEWVKLYYRRRALQAWVLATVAIGVWGASSVGVPNDSAVKLLFWIGVAASLAIASYNLSEMPRVILSEAIVIANEDDRPVGLIRQSSGFKMHFVLFDEKRSERAGATAYAVSPQSVSTASQFSGVWFDVTGEGERGFWGMGVSVDEAGDLRPATTPWDTVRCNNDDSAG